MWDRQRSCQLRPLSASGGEQRVAALRTRSPLQGIYVNTRGLDEILVVVQGDGIPDLWNAPEFAMTRIQIDDGLDPLIVIVAEFLSDI